MHRQSFLKLWTIELANTACFTNRHQQLLANDHGLNNIAISMQRTLCAAAAGGAGGI